MIAEVKSNAPCLYPVSLRTTIFTVILGTDDLESKTSLSGVDLYPDVYHHINSIKNLRKHPYEFYQKLGYVITGVVPDANGLGKPDILMSKRIRSR